MVCIYFRKKLYMFIDTITMDTWYPLISTYKVKPTVYSSRKAIIFKQKNMKLHSFTFSSNHRQLCGAKIEKKKTIFHESFQKISIHHAFRLLCDCSSVKKKRKKSSRHHIYIYEIPSAKLPYRQKNIHRGTERVGVRIRCKAKRPYK